MGSLIKNPGGTIVTGGGYVAGRAELVERAVARLTAPGVGMDAGCVPGETLRLMFQGLWMAPQLVGEALKGGRLAAAVLAREGFCVTPAPGPCTPWSFITGGRRCRMAARQQACMACGRGARGEWAAVCDTHLTCPLHPPPTPTTPARSRGAGQPGAHGGILPRGAAVLPHWLVH